MTTHAAAPHRHRALALALTLTAALGATPATCGAAAGRRLHHRIVRYRINTLT